KINLANFAYTLQVGREAMEERLGLIVHSIEELKEKLQDFIESREDIEDFYLGQVKRNKDTLAVFTADEDLQKAMEAWISKGKYSKLLDLWVKGLIFDWNKLYGDNKPQRMSAPTYPFARERYWIPDPQIAQITQITPTEHSAILHPLLHQNTSDLTEQRFSSTFTGEEFFLKDHQVKGEKVLPGAAYLEMAREAVRQASGEFLKDNQEIHLKNIVWARPVVVKDDPQEVNIGLFPEENGEIAYEIYTDSPNQEEEPLVHSQGVAVLTSSNKVPTLNLVDLQKKINQRSLSPQECYEAFKSMGINYGPAHKGLEKVY
ncbi:MAG: type I polyketide synthase, partial [Chloroflexi bacterium]|nr:type I polyketide synthase [Chloroflexota bacterium]